ncbi:hypothetical protein G5V58_07260 [Nocardioides anomalus]|uniref:DUF2567 domain-containing protein n=1 Tax=Nocardioides anomalus TaxID=2712223 RepID=A0A6G6WBJ1_9ACTN|nr:hypothetical protein [Nocardioides anomalus]QIG42602.1 hypothetical protein G5V58_07260 [Nocardioides anomalus]
MSDGLTAAPIHEPPAAPPARARRPVRVVLVQALVVLALFAVAGLGAGYLWHHLWDSPRGLVAGHQWYTDEHGLRDDFAGVAWYVVVAAPTGLVLGLLCAWFLGRAELVTLVAVLAGSVLAAYLMLVVGYHLSPPDPQIAARTAKDGTRLQGALRVDQWPPRGAFPFGALVGLALVYALTGGRSAQGPQTPEGSPEQGLGEGTPR